MSRHQIQEYAGIQACCCATLEGSRADRAATFALAESAFNRPPEETMNAMVVVGMVPPPPAVSGPTFTPAAIHLIGKTWEVGRTIGLGFLDGSSLQRQKVQRISEELLEFANIKFDWGAQRPDVRISMRGPGSASYLGTDCHGIRSGPTMWYGWVTDHSKEADDRAVILHEFLHMLGFGHEQAHPDRTIQFDIPKTTDYYMRTQGWSEQMVWDNVFHIYSPSEISGSAYDPRSIMQYPVPPELTLDGVGIGWNAVLSETDIVEIVGLYPGVFSPPVVTPPVPPVVPPDVPPAEGGAQRVTIGGPAAKQMIEEPGAPARFVLNVPTPAVLEVAVAVERGANQPLRVVVLPAGLEPMVLPLPRGKARGLFRFDALEYEFRIWHPYARRTGNVFLKVTPKG